MARPPATLHLLCGKIAAGKSTLAATLADAQGTVLISEDHWLARLYPGEIGDIADYARAARRLCDAIGPHIRALLRAAVSTRRHRLVPALAALLAACGQPPAGTEPAPKAAARGEAEAAQPGANEVAAPEIPDDAALADMSPRQRRAYELGFRDCSAGRYDPDPHPEAYRIGCGAAEETKAGRPEG